MYLAILPDPGLGIDYYGAIVPDGQPLVKTTGADKESEPGTQPVLAGSVPKAISRQGVVNV